MLTKYYVLLTQVYILSWCLTHHKILGGENMKMNKRGVGIGDLLPYALVLIVAVIGIGVGADILTTINAGFVANSSGDNITTAGLEGLGELGSWVPTIAIVIAAALVIGILVRSFSMGKN